MSELFAERSEALFSRKGALDPALLLELAPLIPDRLLPRAIQLALGIRYPALDLRARVVEALASRLKPEDEALLDQTLLAAKAVMFSTDESLEPALLRVLVPILPPRLLPQALQIAVRIVAFDTRLDVLAALAGRLPPEQREAALRQALEAIRSAEFEGERASALTVLAKHLPESLLEEALNLAASLKDGEARAEVSTALAASLPGEKKAEILGNALKDIRGIKDPNAIARALAELAPNLSSEQLVEALGMAKKIRPLSPRIGAVAALAAHLPNAERATALRESLAQARRIRTQEDRVRAVSALAPLMPEEERGALLAEVLEYARRMGAAERTNRPPSGFVDLSSDRWTSWKYAEARGSGLGELASSLPEDERLPVLTEALAAAWLTQDDWPRARLLTELAPLLPDSLRKEAQETDKEIQSANERVFIDSAVRGMAANPLQLDYVAEVIARLPEEERLSPLAEAVKAARSIRTLRTRARALTTLVRLHPEEQRSAVLAEVVNLARSVKDPRERATLYASLMPVLSDPERSRVLQESLDLLRSAESDDLKVDILWSLVPVLPKPSPPEALDAIRSIGDRTLRGELLWDIVPYLPESELPGILWEVLGSAKDEVELSLRIENLAPRLPRPLLRRALDLARDIKDGSRRADAMSAALASLAAQATGSERDDIMSEALNEAFFTSRPRGGRGGRADPLGLGGTTGRAAKVLAALPDAKKEPLLDQWLGPLEAAPQVSDMAEAMASVKSAPPLPPQQRVVNTGFAPFDGASESLDIKTPLGSGRSYYFWLDVGELDPHSMEKAPTPIPVEHLPSEALLRVAVFGLTDEIEVTSGADVGELQLSPDGTARVARQPSLQYAPPLPAELAEKRLFFPVSTPRRPGTFGLRCNIYFEQILVQSRLVQAHVMEQPQPMDDALRSVVDYTLSHTLWPAHLNRLESHRLSLMLNSNGEKTHALIFGQNGGVLFKNQAVLSATELKNPIDDARKALWKISWGDAVPWTGAPSQQYRYLDQIYDLGRLKNDVTNLAIRGYILYNAIIDKLTGGRQKSYELEGLMRKPGLVQIALKESASHVLPAAFFYDYDLDTQANEHKLCEAFEESLLGKDPLEKTACFNGACPSNGKRDHVCPSGFWGYRHSIGMPVSVAADMDAAPEILLQGKPVIVAGVATNLDQLDRHMLNLQALRSNLGWNYSDNREKILDLLRTAKAHVVYFYCHGGLANNVPYLQVGAGSDYIEGSNLRAYHIFWDGPRPLVFINGCHTTAVDPEQAINLVQDFVNTGGAGVIGTEITIFEPLACSFAEECLRLFLSGEKSIGEAVRLTRLKLLKEGNPLGLVYTPFVIPSLSLKS